MKENVFITIKDALGNGLIVSEHMESDEKGNLFYIWAGINKNRQFASTGIYKVYIKTLDTDNTSHTFETSIYITE